MTSRRPWRCVMALQKTLHKLLYGCVIQAQIDIPETVISPVITGLSRRGGGIVINRIDRLLEKAKSIKPKMFPTVATISRADGAFMLAFRLWDGIDGSGEQVIQELFESTAAAKAGYTEFLRLYPAGKHEPVLIDMVARG